MPVGQFQVESEKELSTLPSRAAVTWLNSPQSERPSFGVTHLEARFNAAILRLK
jgi:hypothetical protein